MTTSEELWLKMMDDFLADQQDYFLERIKLIEHPHVLGQENAAFLEVDDALAKPAIEEAIESFIRGGRGPIYRTANANT